VEKKAFRYFAIRVGNFIIFRKTVGKIRRVKSMLYRPYTEFVLTQVTYTGGKIVGCMPYKAWLEHSGKQFSGIMLVPRDKFRALIPFIHGV
jgi:hypothetical protein